LVTPTTPRPGLGHAAGAAPRRERPPTVLKSFHHCTCRLVPDQRLRPTSCRVTRRGQGRPDRPPTADRGGPRTRRRARARTARERWSQAGRPIRPCGTNQPTDQHQQDGCRRTRTHSPVDFDADGKTIAGLAWLPRSRREHSLPALSRSVVRSPREGVGGLRTKWGGKRSSHACC
jgi:hypothetical protein